MDRFSGILLLLLLGFTGILACDMDKLANLETCFPPGLQNFDPETSNIDDLCEDMHKAKRCFDEALEGCEGDIVEQSKAAIEQGLAQVKPFCPEPGPDGGKDGSKEGGEGGKGCDMDKLMNIQDCVPQTMMNFDPDTGNLDELCRAVPKAEDCYEDALRGCEGEIVDQAKANVGQFFDQYKSICPEESGSEALRIAFFPVLAMALLVKVIIL